MKKLILSAFLLTAAIGVEAQQKPTLKLPALSTTQKISQDFSTGTIELSYSRPSVRGRKIFGDLVPYGVNWRTGANSATKIKFSEDVIIGGKEVAAGEYAMYTVPTEGDWTVILNKGTGNWGTTGYDKKNDVVRFKAHSYFLNSKVETFTMNFGNIGFSTCRWSYL